MNQPDFTKIFFDYLGGDPKKVKYELRDDPYLVHDLQFLSSLIHDATFKLTDVEEHEKQLTLHLQRDCWELGQISDDKQLLTTKSKLTFTGVVGTKWSLKGLDTTQNEEMEINDLFRGELSLPRKDTFELILCGYPKFWELRITLADEGFGVILRDINIPS